MGFLGAPSLLVFGLASLMSGKFCSIFTLFMLLPVEGGVRTGADGAAPCLVNQSLALLRFKQGLSLEPLTSFDTWQHGSDCCDWEGVSCDLTTGFVTDLNLHGFQVQAGELVPSLLELPRLRRLDLSQSNLLGSTIPSKLSELTDLTYLDLSGCNITGPIPEFFKQLPNLIELDLSGNSLSGEIPPGLLTHPTLRYLNLRSNNLIGRLPEFGSGPSALREVKLDTNMLDGPIPSSIRNLPHLEWLDLESNRFSGTLHLSLFENLKNLSYLYLSDNKLSVEMPKVVDFHHQATLFPRLDKLSLRNCSIKGEFPWFLRNVKSLTDLDLSHNNISGIIPKWLWGLSNLVGLDLSHNMLQGFEDVVDIGGSVNLGLNLSFNHKFPSKSPMKMVTLDLSNNNIGGAIPPAAFCNMFELYGLYLSGNNFIGTIPDCIANLTTLFLLSLSDNQLDGDVPRGIICGSNDLRHVELNKNRLGGEITRIIYNCSSDLWDLDLSYNRLTGSLPENWLTNFPELYRLDLSNNQLHGPIPGELNISLPPFFFILELSDNQFVGGIPRFLSKCYNLRAVNFARNRLTDVFPFWLGRLDHLRVLLLSSNKLFGPLESNFSEHAFPSLHVIDISGNQLTGCLPTRLFLSFSSMIMEKYGGDDLPHGNFFFDGELPLTIKGQTQPRTALAIFTSTLASIDFSDNQFTGRIPEEMGTLKLLYSLNLSRNNLDGLIPRSFGNFVRMESLDLSHNRLSGSIPEELTKDTFLSVLDLSYNNLQGRIPQGNQLNTFGDASFVGNEGLCGSPLPISCPNNNSGSRGSINGIEEKADQDPHWEYLATGIGFAVGLLTIIIPVLFVETVGSWYWICVDRALHAFLRFLPHC